MVMIPNLQEIPLRHSWLLQPASQDHTLGALLKMACGRCHCALQGKDDYPESSEEIFMSSFEQPNGLKMDDDSDWDWWKKWQGKAQCNLLIKTWSEQKVSKKLQLGMFTALTWDCIKRIYCIDCCTLSYALFERAHDNIVRLYVFAIWLYLILVHIFNCLSIYMKSTECTS